MPLACVSEVMRPLPLRPVAGVPPSVLGVAVVRGTPLPVVDAGALLGDTTPPQHTRWATIRYADRMAVLAVEGVLGVRVLGDLERLPPLLDASDVVVAIAAADAGLTFVLGHARLLPPALWATLTGTEPAA